jgi:hypothetical protein
VLIIQLIDLIVLNFNARLLSPTMVGRVPGQCGENRVGVAQIPPDFGNLRG